MESFPNGHGWLQAFNFYNLLGQPAFFPVLQVLHVSLLGRRFGHQTLRV
jgi:hypothetical protein